MTDAIVSLHDLTRVFRRRGKGWRAGSSELVAVDSMTFDIEAGAAVGYIGANGAG